MKTTVKNLIYNVLLAICAIAFLVSAGMLIHKLYEEKKQEDVFSQLMEVFPESETGADAQSGSPEREPEQDSVPGKDLPTVQEKAWEEWHVRLAGYEKLWENNHDFVGWIRVDGTKIDYPVMQSLDREDYYLNRNFDKSQSAYGVPYVSEVCVPEPEGTNLLIYGHHMKNGSMFAALEGYRDARFYRDHPYIRFDTLEGPSIYEVTGAWLIPNASSAGPVDELFKLLFPLSKADFDVGWKAASQRLFVNTGIELSPERRLLALVTCDYSYNNSRIVVLAQQIKED